MSKPNHGGSRGGGGSASSNSSTFKGLEKFRDYEYGYDNEFKTAVGKRLYNKLANAQSTVRVIDSAEDSGFKLEQRAVTKDSLGFKTNRMTFAREKDNRIENLSINTREGYLNGERVFYLDSAAYEWHYAGD